MVITCLYDVANAAAYAETGSYFLWQKSKVNILYDSLKSYFFGIFLYPHLAVQYVNEVNAL